ncbi:MAG TPA: hypothetical protein VNQ79_13375 [Blastocatellia bacterium]|nr:hypothetical protein [Blastocatellia bacterium]
MQVEVKLLSHSVFARGLWLAVIMLLVASSASATTLYYGIGLNGILQMNRTTGAGTLIYSGAPFPAGSNAAALAIQQTSGDLYWVQYATSSGAGSLYRWNPGQGGTPALIGTIAQSATGSSVIVRLAFNPINGKLYAMSANTSNLYELSPTTAAINATITLTAPGTDPPANPASGDLAFDISGKLYFLANSSGGNFRLYSITLSGSTGTINHEGRITGIASGTPNGLLIEGSNMVLSTNGQIYTGPLPAVPGSGATIAASATSSAVGYDIRDLCASDFPDLTKSFSPVATSINIPATLTFTMTNGSGFFNQPNLSFTDTLPAGLVVAPAPNIVNTCGGTVTATSGSGSISVSGAVLSSGTASCQVKVNVIASAPGSYTNGPANLTAFGGGLVNSASDQTLTVANAPSIALTKSCTAPADCVTAAQQPGTELTFMLVFTNSGGIPAQNLIISDPVPQNTDFKLGSAAINTGTTGLTLVVEYSNDYDSASPGTATWTYTPVSGGGGAASGYDRNVKAVRWRVTSGTLSQTAPDNTGNVSLTVRIR